MPRSVAHALGLSALVVMALVALPGCTEKRSRSAGPAAAKVNREEISVQQVATALQQQRNLRPEQADAAGRMILERLIDQELAVQKAAELELQREPRVEQLLEAARREVLARAYAEKVAEAAAKPTAAEVHQYYEDKPALFKERRIYNLQEIAIEAKPEQVPALREHLAAAKNMAEFVDYLKASELRFVGNQAVRAAEQLPLASLDTISRMKDGQAIVVPAAAGLQVLVLAGSRSVPVTEEQARPAIEQFILNERRRKLVEENLKSLRAAARIEYQGRFAEGAKPPAAAASAADALLAPAASSALGADDPVKGAPTR